MVPGWCSVPPSAHRVPGLDGVDEEGGGGGAVGVLHVRHHQHLRRRLASPQRVELHCRVERRDAQSRPLAACHGRGAPMP